MSVQNALDQQREVAKQLVSEYLDGGMSRRDMLKRAGALGLSVPVLSAALTAGLAFAGCAYGGVTACSERERAAASRTPSMWNARPSRSTTAFPPLAPSR